MFETSQSKSSLSYNLLAFVSILSWFVFFENMSIADGIILSTVFSILIYNVQKMGKIFRILTGLLLLVILYKFALWGWNSIPESFLSLSFDWSDIYERVSQFILHK